MQTGHPPAADATRGYRLSILLLLLAINALSYADRHLFSILIPAIKADFAATDTLLGLIAGPGFIISYVVFSMPLARLADRWSRRGVLAVAAILWSTATAACGTAANLAQLAIARFVVGVGEAGGLPPSQSIVADLYGERRRSGALGVLASSTYFGLVLGLFGGAAIADQWGWRAAFLVLALPGIPLALLLWWSGPRRDRVIEQSTSGAGQVRSDTLLVTVREYWQTRSLLLLAIGVGVFNIFGYAAAIWLPAYFMRSHGMSIVEVGAWLGMGAAVGGILGSLASGWLVDWLRLRDESWQLRVPAIGFVIAFPLFVAMFTLPGSSSLTVGQVKIPIVALLSVATGFLSALWAGPAFGAAARLVPPEKRAQATAMLVIIVNVIGSTLGPVTAGLVSDLLTPHAGEEALRYSLMIMSVLTLAGGTLFWRASTHYPHDLLHAADPTVPPPPAAERSDDRVNQSARTIVRGH